MTVRRINVSQVNGNDANENNESEIRPYGEIGLFEGDYIESIDQDRLELLIFNGKRTNIKSKVLSPGMFYGSNSDSGDGYNLDTIKLIPDAELYYNNGDYGNDQYLVVDPTAPNHIHLRAGGTIDQSTADLFLGGEKNSIRISDGYDNITISTDDNSSGTNQWTFDSAGDLTFPTSGNIIFDSSAVSVIDGITSIQFADATVQTTAWTGTVPNAVIKSSGTWTVTPGTDNYSFSVDPNGTYIMWVLGNIPNGIIKWNATATISNTNVPVAGTQYAWVYDGAGTPLDFTSIPSQFTVTANTIVRNSGGVSNSNVFTFGINNSSGSGQIVNYGWIKIS